MKLYFFTYFLNRIAPLYDSSEDKNTILKKIIGKRMVFSFNKSKYVYVCHNSIGNWVHAKLGKEGTITKSMPSETDFLNKNETTYPHCNIFFNCSDNPESGQRIAFESKSGLFRPNQASKAIREHINTKLFGKGYAMSIESIEDKEEFWAAVKMYKGRIERLTFSYNAPNVFKLDDDLSDSLTGLVKKYGATKSSMILENQNGNLRIPKDDLISESHNYISKGGGNFKLKIKGMNRTIKSGNVVKSMNVSEIELETSDEGAFIKIMGKIFSMEE